MAQGSLGRIDPKDTSADEFSQAARNRAEDFRALRAAGRWTASVYLGPYIVELRLKHLVCTHLRVANLPTALKVHELGTLMIYCGKQQEFATQPPALQQSFQKLASIHEAGWRYKSHAPSHKDDSDNLHGWLFDEKSGILNWLGV